MFSALATMLATVLVFVPLDDRPVTRQLPVMLGAIAGVTVAEPPLAMLGRYLEPGDPAGIERWLREDAPADARDYVVSLDMMEYGGLIGSRAPGVPQGQAFDRLSSLAATRALRPKAHFATFGTVMRLAPTGVPKLGAAASFFAAGPVWPLIQQYANLPDPPQMAEQRALAARIRERVGPSLDAYLQTRARDLQSDLYAMRLTAEGDFNSIVFGQDDAGPVGLHLRDLVALRAARTSWGLEKRVAIEPGADELGMALVGAALAREADIVPRIAVVYSRADGGTINDPLEFAPIATTIADLTRTCGGVAANDPAHADIVLYVRVPNTGEADERTFVDALSRDVALGRTVAVADLSFLASGDLAQQRALVEDLIARNLAGRIAAFASWNTTANTVGTAIPEAIAVLAGRALGTYHPVAHAQFMLDRYADDYAFHDFVRPALNDALKAEGIADHAYLTPEVAQETAAMNRTDLWPRTLDLLASIYPQYRDAGLTITLPWNRTFETELDVRLAPR
jgi:hypothetical protein